MELRDLLEAPNSALTDEELEVKISMLRKMRVVAEEELDTDTSEDDGEDGEGFTRLRKRKSPRVKSNKERQVDSLLDSLTPEEKERFSQILAERRKND